MAPYTYDRSHLIYELVVRQEPKQARMCGVGGKADRRPIDPPPIVQLRVVDPALQSGSAASSSSRARRDSASNSESDSPRSYTEDAIDTTNFTQSYLQNPYYFMFASLARPDDDAELHWLKDGRTRCTTGSVVSSLYHLKDPQNNNQDAGFFVFPDLSVRTEGSYRLKLSLYEVVGNNVHHCKSIYSAPFYVYTAKKFPGMEESTPLSCSLADQGIKIRIRKDIRVRKRPIPALSQPLPIVDGQESDGDDDDEDEGSNRQRTQRYKRMRLDNSRDASGSIPVAQQQQLPWPPVASTNPALGPTIPPPPAAPPNSGSSSTTVIPPPPKPGQELPPANGIAMGVRVPPGSTLPGPSVFDGRGGGIILDNSQPAATSGVASNQQQTSANGASPMQFREPNQSEGAAPLQASPTPSQVSPPVQQQQHQYPASTASGIAPQQPLQSQHHPTTTALPPQPAPQPLVHVPPPIQHQPQHSQHVQHPQPTSNYAHYSQWGANPMPNQPTMYDPYYHHQQHPHYATYAPPLPQPPPHPPARYDYTTGMYTAPPPPAISGYGYYDQHQQHHQPHPQQQMMPHSYPQHQQHQMHAPPPPQHQYVPSAPMTNGSSVVNNSSSTATDGAHVGNGTTGAVSPNPVQAAPNFSASSNAQVTAPTPAPAAPIPGGPYDYTAAVYNGRPHNENPTARAGYVAQTTGQVPAPYMVHPAAPPHPPHAQTYALHATPSAGPLSHHPHVATMRHNPYGPPPLHPHAPPPHPAYSYTPQYGAPPPPATDWGAQPFVGPVSGHHTGWDAYGHHTHQSQHPQQQSHAVAQQTQVSPSSTGAMNSVSSQGGHRVQLAPLMNTHESTNDTNASHVARDGGNTHNCSPVMQTSPIRSSGTSLSPSTMRSGGRSSISTTVRERHGGEAGHAGNQSQGQGKKNPLSIGSIISDDAR